MRMFGGGGGTVHDERGPNIVETDGPGGPPILGDHLFCDTPSERGGRWTGNLVWCGFMLCNIIMLDYDDEHDVDDRQCAMD